MSRPLPCQGAAGARTPWPHGTRPAGASAGRPARLRSWAASPPRSSSASRSSASPAPAERRLSIRPVGVSPRFRVDPPRLSAHFSPQYHGEPPDLTGPRTRLAYRSAAWIWHCIVDRKPVPRPLEAIGGRIQVGAGTGGRRGTGGHRRQAMGTRQVGRQESWRIEPMASCSKERTTNASRR